MPERSVACSDLSSLHSYFSTGIVRLISPLHNRCHLSVRLRAVQNLRGFSGYDCKAEQGADVGKSRFRQALDTLSKPRQICEGHNPRTMLGSLSFRNFVRVSFLEADALENGRADISSDEEQ